MTTKIDTKLQDQLLDEWFDSTEFDVDYGDELPEEGGSEEKGIRYVRTPEGAAHYGQPIGTPIVTDAVPAPNTTSPASVMDAVRASRSAAGRAPATSPASRQKASPINWTTSWDGKQRATKGGRYEVEQFTVGDSHFWALRGMYQRKKGDVAKTTYDSGQSKTPELAKKAAERALKAREATWQGRGNRDYENVYDMWPGVPGYDYDPVTGGDPDPEMVEKYESDYEYRKQLAINTTRSLGIEIVSDSAVGFDAQALEDINAVMMVHEEMYPGFLGLMKNIGVSDMYEYGGPRGGPIAYNTVRPGNYVPGEPLPGYQTILRFNSYFYGDHDDVEDNAGQVRYAFSNDNAWHVGNETMMEEYGDYFAPAQIMQLKTTIHEIGHTLGNIGLGVMDVETLKGADRRTEFMEGLKEVLDTWEITTTDMTPSQFSQEAIDNLTNGMGNSWAPFAKMDRAVLHEVLSAYGSSSMHEMFAEAWCEYLFDPDPRDFSIALGDLLSDTLVKYLWDQEEK